MEQEEYLITVVKTNNPSDEYDGEVKINSAITLTLSELGVGRLSREILEYILSLNPTYLKEVLNKIGYYTLDEVKSANKIDISDKDSLYYCRGYGLQEADKWADPEHLADGVYVRINPPEDIKLKIDKWKKSERDNIKKKTEAKKVRELEKAKKILEKNGFEISAPMEA